MTCGDNIHSVHKMITLEETEAAIVAYCDYCKRRYCVRKDDRGRPEQPLYSKIFKRDTLQPHENLYYKEYPGKMNVV